MSNDPQFDAYAAQVKKLHQLAHEWLKAHPQSNAKIQFNFPKEVGLIATMHDALKNKLVMANPQGMVLLGHMGALTNRPDTPSVFMVRIAIEHMDEEVE
jgi:hypothetical protein